MEKNKSNQKESRQFTADTVWGAAAHAHRVNSGYIGSLDKQFYYSRSQSKNWGLPSTLNQDGQWDNTNLIAAHVETRVPNRDLIWKALASPDLISKQDHATGMRAKDFLTKQLLLKTLKGPVSNFDQSLSAIMAKDSFTSRDRLDIALIASQILAYENGLRQLAIIDRIDRSKGYLANVGNKVQANVEITKSVYSQNYNVYFISGVTDTNQAVFFSYRDCQKIGAKITIKGTVKAHRTDATQLNRVRVLSRLDSSTKEIV